ncbi:MAG: hypothetical protein IIZ93_06620 [Acidaminococcaceae bacterium]|nr:hypothetical protein [Acidaminococcaceae bacterium]
MNSVINEVLEAVIGLMNAAQPFATVTRGALPTGQGITCEIGPTTPLETYMDKNTDIPLDVTLNGKHANLETLSDALNNIHSALTRATQYPEGQRWQIVDITTQTFPDIVDREQNNVWLMASALSVNFYWKGD